MTAPTRGQTDAYWLDFKTAQRRVAVALVRCGRCGAPAGVTCHSINYRMAPNATHADRVRKLGVFYTFRAKKPNVRSTASEDFEGAIARA